MNREKYISFKKGVFEKVQIPMGLSSLIDVSFDNDSGVIIISAKDRPAPDQSGAEEVLKEYVFDIGYNGDDECLVVMRDAAYQAMRTYASQEVAKAKQEWGMQYLSDFGQVQDALETIDKLQSEITEAKKNLEITEHLLADRQKLLEAIPECAAHGQCVPHALEWIKKMRARV